jgi:hypothetical protein
VTSRILAVIVVPSVPSNVYLLVSIPSYELLSVVTVGEIYSVQTSVIDCPLKAAPTAFATVAKVPKNLPYFVVN